MKKKITGMVFIVLMAMSASAQNMTVNAGRTTFGVRAGVNFQNINGESSNGVKLENSLTTGFHAGVNAEIPLGTGFYVQPGVLYSTKGTKYPEGYKMKPAYVEVPLNLIYKPVLGTGNMVLGFGPYLGIGVGGKAIDPDGTKSDITFHKTYNTATGGFQFNPLDAGANFLAGYEFSNKLSFQLNAQLGLVDIDPQYQFSNNETRWRNTGWGLSLGYRF
jgi:hypothetical protein